MARIAKRAAPKDILVTRIIEIIETLFTTKTTSPAGEILHNNDEDEISTDLTISNEDVIEAARKIKSKKAVV
jgi:hypothetical protein